MAKQKSSKKKETFSYFAPEAQAVLLAGSFNDWGQQPITLKKQKSGLWKGAVALEPGAYEYRFLVDGEWRDDPDCATRVANPFSSENCVRIVESSGDAPKAGDTM